MIAPIDTSRRRFLKLTGITGGGLVMGVTLTACGEGAPALEASARVYSPNAFLQITPSNNVRFYCPRDEMGQGVTTGLSTLIAEELDVRPDDIDVRFAGVHADYSNPEFGVQGTGGSTSIRVHYEQLRQVGANVRFVLMEAASQVLGVPKTELSTANGSIMHGGKSYRYGDFVDRAAEVNATEPAPLKNRAEFNYIGKEFARLDAKAKATGTAIYGIDVDIKGMHYAVVKRCPVAGGVVARFDADSISDLPGVTDVVQIDTGVAIVATRFWQAKNAAGALQVDWTMPDLVNVSTAQVKTEYKRALDDEKGDVDGEAGDLGAGFRAAKHVVESEYWTPYLAHTPLEPMNAVVHIQGDKAQVWSGTQGPGVAQGLVARYAGLEKANVTVHSTYMGGGFGRRGVLTHIAEATQIAVAAAKPIQLVWTREDDIQNGFYRPASLMRIKSAVDKAGKITAWRAKRVGGNVTPETIKNMLPGLLPTIVPTGMAHWVGDVSASIFDGWAVDHSSIEGLYEDYDCPNREVHHVTLDHGLPLTFWRSVGHSFTAFAKEIAIDELAEVAELHPVELRIQNTEHNPRLQNVIRLVGERAKEGDLPDGHKIGYAAHSSFMSYVAQAAQVSIENGKIRVHRVICAVDCGQVVNPGIVRGQMEGAIMFGLTAALHGEIELENGAVKQSNFHDYPILRMTEAPAVETILVDSAEPPSGVGEPGLPPIAPAVANAVYAVTGQRLRSLPLRLA